jgi:hypothetical protein
MSVNYYESVLNFMGVEETMDFYRLYMVPVCFIVGAAPGMRNYLQIQRICRLSCMG